ncbi:MAG: glycosyltransferase, partial [Acidobacteriota bacterium]
LGQGDDIYANRLLEHQKKFPHRFALRLEMSPASVHKLAAGADMFLIPSLSEPCGLNQLYGFRYGTVPIVRATGGLKETVKPFNRKTQKGNGFVFKEYSASSLLSAVKEAVDCYKKPALWERIVNEGIKERFSWEEAARKYVRLYRSALKKRTGGENHG